LRKKFEVRLLKNLVNIGVIGAGYWGKKVIPEYQTLAKEYPKVNLLGVCDVQEQNLRYCKEVLHIPKKRLLNSHSELLKLSNLDAVHICIPNEIHFEICKEALMAGKHVLLEKPMTLNSQHAFELKDLAKKENLGLQVGYIFRFNNALRKIRELIGDGLLGDLYYLRLQWTALVLPTPKRDIIFDLGAHPVDIVNFLLDMWPSKVVCKARAYTRQTLPETAYAIMELDTKIMANFELSWLQHGKARRVDVIGSKRSVTIDCLNQNIEVFENHDKIGSKIDVKRNNTILTEIKHFVDHLTENGDTINSGYVGPMNVLVLEKLKESLVENRTVKIDSHKYLKK
jgi:UDP-N-acetylglucosamine 3-dehydrogenase